MNKAIFVLSLTLFTGFFICCDLLFPPVKQGTINGVVKDKDGNILVNVLVSAEDEISTYTNSSGYYQLEEVPAGLVCLKTSKEGFLSSSMKVDLLSDENLTQDIEMHRYAIFFSQEVFSTGLDSDAAKNLNFDVYPDKSEVPTGYLPNGTWTGFELNGDEWSSSGVTFTTPSSQHMSTASITEWPEAGDTIENYISYPNSLTLGPPPYVGYGVSHDSGDGDAVTLIFSPAVKCFGIHIIDSSGNDTEMITIEDENDEPICTIPMDQVDSFFGIISHIPIAKVRINEISDDSDDVAYDDVIFGPMKEGFSYLTNPSD